jgi:hypothetical protein
MVLARLGHGGVTEYVTNEHRNPNLTSQERLGLSLAVARTPYPKELGVSAEYRATALARERDKQRAIQAALARREQLLRQERVKQAALARAREDKDEADISAREAAESEAEQAAAAARRAADEEARVAAAAARKAAADEAKMLAERKAAQSTEKALAAKKAAEMKAADEAARRATETEAKAIAARQAADAKAAASQKAAEVKAAAQAAREAQEAEKAATAARKAAEAEAKAAAARQAAEAKAAAEAARQAQLAEEKAAAARQAAEAESAAAAARAAAEAAKKTVPVPVKPPVPFPTMGQSVEETPAKQGTPEKQVASLPPDTMPPPLDSVVPKSKSLMNYVDLVVQVKKNEAPLFQNPGDTPIGSSLPAGSKGRADFEVMIGEDKWYQVKSKKGNGWVNGKFLTVFNLSPGSEAPVVQTPPPPSQIEGGRKESTYFEASIENAPLFEKPSESSKKVGQLTEATPYLAVRSEKVGPNRWFLLQIRAGETGWAQGSDLQLADVQQPNVLEIPTSELSQRGKQSAFKAEWINAAVKGVGVYSRPSIVAKMIRQINPKEVFKVVDAQSAGGYEWYKIELSEKEDGWVQTMDVKLTKKPK